MILTSDGDKTYVTTLSEHLSTAAQLFAALDEATYEVPEPRELFAYAVANHDAGWATHDQAPSFDSEAGLPFGVFTSPTSLSSRIYPKSVELNGAHHAYCGLLVGMHAQGLFNGRFGEGEADELEPEMQQMMQVIETRCDEFRAHLQGDPTTRDLIIESKILRSYRLLQLFDRLALHLNLGIPPRDTPIVVQGIPKCDGSQVDILVYPREAEGLLLEPFPFVGDEIKVRFTSRKLQEKSGTHEEMLSALDRADPVERSFYLRRRPVDGAATN